MFSAQSENIHILSFFFFIQLLYSFLASFFLVSELIYSLSSYVLFIYLFIIP